MIQRKTQHFRPEAESPKAASAANLFGSTSSSTNNFQYESFVNNEQSFASLPTTSSYHSIPPPQQQNSGPPSLDGTSSNNPYRNMRQRGHRATAGNLFNNAPTASSSFTPTYTPQNISGLQPQSSFIAQSLSVNNVAPDNASTCDNLVQPLHEDAGNLPASFSIVNVSALETLRVYIDPDDSPDDVKEPWKFNCVGERFKDYPSVELSPEKKQQAEEDNDKLRRQKIENRSSNLQKLQAKKTELLAQQKAHWAKIEEQNNLMDSFKTTENKPSAKLVLSKEERRELRKRAEKVRHKKSTFPPTNDDGSLEGLINDVSSRGTSLCSDLSSDVNDFKPFHDGPNDHSLTSTTPTQTMYSQHVTLQNIHTGGPPTDVTSESGNTNSQSNNTMNKHALLSTNINTENYSNKQNFISGQNFNNLQNFNSRQNFDNIQNFDKVQNFNTEQYSSNGQTFLGQLESNQTNRVIAYDSTDFAVSTSASSEESSNTTTSMSSFGIVSANSSENDSRLSPYEIVNNSSIATPDTISPIDIQNISTSSTQFESTVVSASSTRPVSNFEANPANDVQQENVDYMKPVINNTENLTTLDGQISYPSDERPYSSLSQNSYKQPEIEQEVLHNSNLGKDAAYTETSGNKDGGDKNTNMALPFDQSYFGAPLVEKNLVSETQTTVMSSFDNTPPQPFSSQVLVETSVNGSNFNLFNSQNIYLEKNINKNENYGNQKNIPPIIDANQQNIEHKNISLHKTNPVGDEASEPPFHPQNEPPFHLQNEPPFHPQNEPQYEQQTQQASSSSMFFTGVSPTQCINNDESLQLQTNRPQCSHNTQQDIAGIQANVQPSESTYMPHQQQILNNVPHQPLVSADMTHQHLIQSTNGPPLIPSANGTDQPQVSAHMVHQPQLSDDMAHQSKESDDVPPDMPSTNVPDQPQVSANIPHQPQLSANMVHQPQISANMVHQPQLSDDMAHQPQISANMPHQPQLSANMAHQPQISANMPHQPQLSANMPHQPQLSANMPHQPQLSANMVHQPQISANMVHQPQISANMPHQPQLSANMPHQPQLSANMVHQPQVSDDVPDQPLVSADLTHQHLIQATNRSPQIPSANGTDQPQVSAHMVHQPQVSDDMAHQSQVSDDVPTDMPSTNIPNQPQLSANMVHQPQISANMVHQPQLSANMVHQPQVSANMPHQPQLSANMVHQPQVSDYIVHYPQVSANMVHQPQVSANMPHQPQISANIAHQPQVSDDLTHQHLIQAIKRPPQILSANGTDQPQVSGDMVHQPQVSDDVPPDMPSDNMPHQPQLSANMPHQPQLSAHIPHQPQLSANVVHHPQVSAHMPRQLQLSDDMPHQPQISANMPHQPQVSANMVHHPQVSANMVHQPQVSANMVHQPQGSIQRPFNQDIQNTLIDPNNTTNIFQNTIKNQTPHLSSNQNSLHTSQQGVASRDTVVNTSSVSSLPQQSATYISKSQTQQPSSDAQNTDNQSNIQNLPQPVDRAYNSSYNHQQNFSQHPVGPQPAALQQQSTADGYPYMAQGGYGQNQYMPPQQQMYDNGMSPQQQQYNAEYAAWYQQWYYYNQQYGGYGYQQPYSQPWQQQWPGYDAYSYTSSAASSTYGSRPGSVIERRSSTSEIILNELGDFTNELSFSRRAASPPPEEIIQRTTPLSFTRAHLIACFNKTGGVLNIVAPKQPLDGEVAFVQNAKLEDIVPITDLKRFPGPLVRGETSKKKILNFINDTVVNILPNKYEEKELFGMKALWEFVAMLTKQNGTFEGSDVAEMLLNLLPTHQVDGFETKNLISSVNQPNVLTTQQLEEFQVLVVCGRLKDALDHAIQYGNWGQAFMLAASMGDKYVTLVQTKFFQSLKPSDPVKTLYGHLLNKDVNFIKKRANVDDWVQNLCVLVSHSCGDKNKDIEKIIAFGDALRTQGETSAAHLAYLIADVSFGNRINLIGLELEKYKGKNVNVACDNLNVQLTEIYQHARRMHDPTFAIPSFQNYLFQYSLQILEYGYGAQALAYFESISSTIHMDNRCCLYERQFCYQLSKYSNQVLLQDVEQYDMKENPPWLSALDSYMNKVTHAPDQDIVDHAVHQENQEVQAIDQSEFATGVSLQNNIQDNSIIRRDDDVVDTVANPTDDYEKSSDNQQHLNNQLDYSDSHQNYTDNQQIYSDTPQNYSNDEQYYGDTPQNYSDNQPNYSDNVQDNYEGQHDNLYTNNFDIPNDGTMEDNTYPNNQNNYQWNQQQANDPQQVPYFQPTAEFGRRDSTSDMSSPRSTYENAAPAAEPYQQPMAPQQVYEESVEDEEDLFGGFSKKKLTINEPTPTKTQSSKEEAKKPVVTPSKKGWFGGIISKLTGNKEVYLPDDKEKSLYFDKTLGKWIDKNADEEEVKALPPPPPTGNFAPKENITSPAMSAPKSVQQQPTSVPTMPAPTMPVPALPEAAMPVPTLPTATMPAATSLNRRKTRTEQQRTLLQVSKSDAKSSTESTKKEKPVGPPSRFSMKASGAGGRRGRYVNVMGGTGGSNTSMKPLVDPMGGGGSNLPGTNNTSTNQMTFFNPAMMQPQQ